METVNEIQQQVETTMAQDDKWFYLTIILVIFLFFTQVQRSLEERKKRKLKKLKKLTKMAEQAKLDQELKKK